MSDDPPICSTCGQPMPAELVWTVEPREGKISVSVTDGTHAGWALRETEAEARRLALMRLRLAQEYAAESAYYDRLYGVVRPPPPPP